MSGPTSALPPDRFGFSPPRPLSAWCRRGPSDPQAVEGQFDMDLFREQMEVERLERERLAVIKWFVYEPPLLALLQIMLDTELKSHGGKRFPA